MVRREDDDIVEKLLQERAAEVRRQRRQAAAALARDATDENSENSVSSNSNSIEDVQQENCPPLQEVLAAEGAEETADVQPENGAATSINNNTSNEKELNLAPPLVVKEATCDCVQQEQQQQLSSRQREALPGAYAEGSNNSESQRTVQGHDNTADEVSQEGIGLNHIDTGNTTNEDAYGEAMPQQTTVDENRNLVTAMPVDDDEEARRVLAQADPVEEEEVPEPRKKKVVASIVVLVSLVLVAVILLIIFLAAKNSDSTSDLHSGTNGDPVREDTNGDPLRENISIPIPPIPTEEYIRNLLPDYTLNALKNSTNSPQSLAFQWLVNDPFLVNYTNADWRLLQRFSLATIYYSTNKMVEPPKYISSGNRTTTISNTGGDINAIGWREQDNWLSYYHHECDWDFTPSFYVGFEEVSAFVAVRSPCLGDDDQDDGVFTELRLKSNDLNGRIPPEIELLTGLKSIDFGFNEYLSGPLPNQAFTKLSALNVFIAAFTGLSGPLPAGLFDVNPSPMEVLAFEQAAFTGTIPSTIGHMTKLALFAAGNNALSGSLPTEIGNLVELQFFTLEYNDLTGPIPSELGLLSSHFTDIYFKNNNFTGTVPTELGLMAKMEEFRLGSNQLSGTIATELGLLSNALRLLLEENQVTGTLPTELGQLTAMERIRLYRNDLSGTIPSELVTLRQTHLELESIQLGDNPRLSGTIPVELCSVPDTFRMVFDCSAQLCGCDCPPCS